MNKIKGISYAPHGRGFFEQKTERIKSPSESGYSKLPNPVSDPIVSNNISNQEFDYTYDDEVLNFDDPQMEDWDNKDNWCLI